VSLALPTIGGLAQQGQTLTATTGSWSNSPTSYAYQWQNCRTTCTDISGATESSYTLQSLDVGDTVDVVVTAANAAGSSAATSAPTLAIASGGVAPALVSEPVISGTVATGDTLTTTNGSWTGSPTSYTYQWQDCGTDGTGCSDISGATNSTYLVQPGDAGHTIEALVTATNGAGSSSPAGAPIVPLVDNFTGSTIDSNVWHVMNQQGDTSNNEVECFLPSQTTEAGGELTETLMYADPFTCPPGTPDSTNPLVWKSGAVEEIGTAFQYGTITVSAEMAGGDGWPAVWLLGAACQGPTSWLTGTPPSTGAFYCPWPEDASDAAEIDIAEFIGNDGLGNTVFNSSGTGGGPLCQTPVPSYSTAFHTYQLIWTATSLTWSMDGSTTCTNTTDVPTHPMFLIIDTAQIGGGTTGGSTVVDYVHVSH
jgi:beta-glucanase (GH16 family)